jgi:hypothetical protein
METSIKICHPSKNAIFITQILKQKIIVNQDSLYSIIKYDKTILCYDDSCNALYRSVVFSFPQKKLLCYSPPKSLTVPSFIQKYPSIENIAIHEKIEGTMVNLFYDNRTSRWEIATRGCVGGRNRYSAGNRHPPYSRNSYAPTYYDMLMDVLSADRSRELNELEFIKELPYKMNPNNEDEFICYSFVLRHPENEICIPTTRPTLHLVAAYLIRRDSVEYIPISVCKSWNIFQQPNSVIDFPKEYGVGEHADMQLPLIEPAEILDYDTIVKHGTCQQNGPNFCGLVMTNTLNGERAVISNPAYEKLHAECANNAELQYIYLCLSRINQENEYTQFFPKHRRAFRRFQEQYHEFIKNVHNAYLIKYVWHSNRHISETYVSHIYKIHHDIYIPSLRHERTPITFKSIKSYFDKIMPRELLFIIHSIPRHVMQQSHCTS